jgi:histone H1/5
MSNLSFPFAAAIGALKERNGSSRQAIVKYVLANYKVGTDLKAVNTRVKVALKSGVAKGAFKQVKGKGASGSFKVEAAAKPKAVKKASAKKPKAAKKAASPKKAAAKKPKATKKAASPKKAATKKPKAAKTEKKPKAAKPKKTPVKKAPAKKAAAKKAAVKK